MQLGLESKSSPGNTIKKIAFARDCTAGTCNLPNDFPERDVSETAAQSFYRPRAAITPAGSSTCATTLFLAW